MRKFHNICTTSIFLHASIVGLAIGVGDSALAELDLRSSVQGIHGGDRHTAGIHGGDRSIRGIHGGDRRTTGIHGGDRSIRGIHGGDRRIAGIHGGDRRIFESAAMGPVESLEIINEGYRLTILGQTFITNLTSIPVAEGDYVLAAGSGESLDLLMPIAMPYVAGASPVLIRGTVSSIMALTAELTVGALVIDYSAHLSIDASFSPEVGEAVEFMGVQPLPGGNAILNIQGGTESYVRGIHGGDRR